MRAKMHKPRPAPRFCENCDRGVIFLQSDGSRWDATVGGPSRMMRCQCQRGSEQTENNRLAQRLRLAAQA